MVASESMAPREKQFNFRLSEEEDARLQAVMKHHGLDASNVVRMLVKREFDKIHPSRPLGPNVNDPMNKADANKKPKR